MFHFFHFLLNFQPYANLLNPLGVPQGLLSPLTNYLSKIPPNENNIGAAAAHQAFPNFKPADVMTNPLLNPNPSNPFLSNLLGNSVSTYPVGGLANIPNPFPLNPPMENSTPFWNHGNFIPNSGQGSQKRTSASETPDMQNELPDKQPKIAKIEQLSEHGVQNDKSMKLGQNGMNSLENSTTYRHRCKFCKKVTFMFSLKFWSWNHVVILHVF